MLSLKHNVKQQTINLEDSNNSRTVTRTAVFLLIETSPLMLCPLVKTTLQLKPLELLDAHSHVEEHAIKFSKNH